MSQKYRLDSQREPHASTWTAVGPPSSCSDISPSAGISGEQYSPRIFRFPLKEKFAGTLANCIVELSVVKG